MSYLTDYREPETLLLPLLLTGTEDGLVRYETRNEFNIFKPLGLAVYCDDKQAMIERLQVGSDLCEHIPARLFEFCLSFEDFTKAVALGKLPASLVQFRPLTPRMIVRAYLRTSSRASFTFWGKGFRD